LFLKYYLKCKTYSEKIAKHLKTSSKDCRQGVDEEGWDIVPPRGLHCLDKTQHCVERNISSIYPKIFIYFISKLSTFFLLKNVSVLREGNIHLKLFLELPQETSMG
jgi:hypothetical protein